VELLFEIPSGKTTTDEDFVATFEAALNGI